MSNKKENDNFAIVEFDPDDNHPHKRLVEVIKYAWLTDEGDKCLCPNPKYWSYELKNHGLPRENWIKYPCRVLKYNIATIKAANIECSKRLNYTTSELSSDEVTQPIELNNNSTAKSTIDYNDLFDKIHDSPITTSPRDDDMNVTTITEQNPVNNVIYTLQYDSLELAEQNFFQKISENIMFHDRSL